MKNRIIGALGFIGGATIVAHSLNTLINEHTFTSYSFSQNIFLFFGASLCLIGLYYLVRRSY